MLGIIGAMQCETDRIIFSMADVRVEKIGRLKFFVGKIANTSLVTVCCGVGKVNAAVAATILITHFGVDKIINSGIAGGVDASLKKLDIVVSESVLQHDYDLSPLGFKTGYLDKVGKDFILCAEPLVKSITESLERQKLSYKKGVIVSGDQFINSTKKAAELSEKYNAIACDMESAAIGQVCALFGLKFAALRVISDSGDDNSDSDYKDFEIKAAERSCKVLLDVLVHF